MKRIRSFLLLPTLLLLGAEARGEAQRSGTTRPPNVVLIITDDQGYGDIAAHGNPVIQTPNLDRLAAQSVRFTDYHVDPTCSPTRAALLTGRYSTKTGVWHTIAGRSLMRPEEVTMAEVFAANGYRTGIFGKWHLGDGYPLRPQDRGFQEVLIHGGGGIGQTPDYWGNDYFDDHYQHNGQWKPFQGYCTDVFVDAALRFIHQNREQPFFVYLPTNVPHSPFIVAKEYEERYRRKGVEPNLAKFYGMITEFDENLGVLLAKLDEWGVAENTILIFTTDNGTAGNGFNVGMRGKKGSQYEGGHRVPFFVRYPEGRMTGGWEIDRMAAHIDVLPTLTELTGVRPPAGVRWDGTSLVPLLRGDPWPERTLFVHSQRVQHPQKWRASAVMTERWRLIDGKELYDIQADPGQKRDVAGEHPQMVSTLRGAYGRWWAELTPRFHESVRVVLGSDAENPVLLTAHDWRTPANMVPWHQDAVAKDDSSNGVWKVEVARPGTYEFILRPRPYPVNHPVGATRARLSIGDLQRSQPVEPGAGEARFQVRLDAGKVDLQTWFESGNGSHGAYYVYVRRLGSAPVALGRSSLIRNSPGVGR